MSKTTTNSGSAVKKRSVVSIAAVLMIMLFTGIICSCKAADKSKPSLNTTETTGPSEETTYGRMKGVVISGRETEVTGTTVATTSTETTEATETTAETAAPTETVKPNTPTKAPAKKPAAKPKTTKKKSTKKSRTKKKTTKKPTSTSTQYSYCTCDAKVNYGVSGMGASGSHTFTGLTAQRNSNGTWKLTSASASTVVSWLNKNVKDKVGKPNWGSYSATITNTRNLRNSP